MDSLQSYLKDLKASFESTIIGQPEAIASIMGALERYQAGLHDGKRPIGTFLFLGPTGVGKTHTVETFASLAQNEDAFIRIDCSEFTLEHEVSKLLGSPPGYVGHDNGSTLTRLIEGLKNPESGFILLLDEIEKAHPKFFDLWLQVMDCGVLTDSKGKKLDFTKSMIFFTSNVGAQHYMDSKAVGFRPERSTVATIEGAVAAELKRVFRPEFLNRLTSRVFFSTLTFDQQGQILENLISDLNGRLEKYYIKVKLSSDLITEIRTKGFSKEYGAREVKRVLVKILEQPLAHAIIGKEVIEDSHILLGLTEGILTTQKIGDYPLLLEEATS